MSFSLEQHLDFLEKVKESLVHRSLSENFSSMSGDEWESLVFEQCLRVNAELGLGWEILNTKAAEFPDIVINRSFGLEVKATKDDHWITLGNSINESRRISHVDTVYFFFGKLGGKFEIAWKPYDKCLKNIATTHYPRYIVDMQLAEGLSIFDRLGITYDDYRKLSGIDRVKLIKEFLRKSLAEGEALWWIDDTTPPVIRNFNKFDTKTKQEFTVMAMAKCPEIFKGARERGKYDRVAQMLLAEYQAVSANLRDHFSASGTMILTLKDGSKHTVPQMIYQLHSNAEALKSLINSQTDDDLRDCWGLQSLPSSDKHLAYAELLNLIGEFRSGGAGTGDFFLDGLKL